MDEKEFTTDLQVIQKFENYLQSNRFFGLILF